MVRDGFSSRSDKKGAFWENAPGPSKLFETMMKLLAFGGRRSDLFHFIQAKVVGVDTAGRTAEASIVYFVKPDDNGVFDTALVNRGNGADVLVPVGLFPENANFRTALNHE
jgi:hypothetical protein